MRNDLSTLPWPWKKPNAGIKEAVELKKPKGRAIRCSVIERIPRDGLLSVPGKIHSDGTLNPPGEKPGGFLVYFVGRCG